MITRRRQSGMSILGIICILVMLGFFAMCIIRMSPAYFESLTIRDIIVRVVTDPETPDMTASDIRRKFAMVFNTNQIYELDYKEVEIFHRKGKTYIDGRYEVRLPILWRIDAVLKFDDLLFEVGNPQPLLNEPPEK